MPRCEKYRTCTYASNRTIYDNVDTCIPLPWCNQLKHALPTEQRASSCKLLCILHPCINLVKFQPAQPQCIQCHFSLRINLVLVRFSSPHWNEDVLPLLLQPSNGITASGQHISGTYPFQKWVLSGWQVLCLSWRNVDLLTNELSSVPSPVQRCSETLQRPEV